jgi:glycosyltransferase involved in cell wall biosynthesis
MRVAYITPYYKESAEVLERCIKSVEAQTIKGDHFLISDGHPQDWVASRVARHIPLGKSHGDYGNTPRGIGAQLAISDGYDAIGLLDADCWLDPKHTEECLKTAIGNYGSPLNCDYVVAKRRFIRPDLTVANILEEANHVDTNCYFLLRGAYSFFPVWSLMPKEFSNVADRVFYKSIMEADLNYATNKADSLLKSKLDLRLACNIAVGGTLKVPVECVFRIDALGSATEFEMQMRATCASGFSRKRDLLACFHFFADLDQVL